MLEKLKQLLKRPLFTALGAGRAEGQDSNAEETREVQEVQRELSRRLAVLELQRRAMRRRGEAQ